MLCIEGGALTGKAMLLSVSTGCSRTGIGSCPGSGTRQFHTLYTCALVQVELQRTTISLG